MKYHNFDKISELLPDVMKKSGLDKGITQIALFNLWSEVVGKRFMKTTKAIKLHGKTLTVATKAPVVTQEMLLFKNDILKKLAILTKNLDIEITEIHFNHKIWAELNKKAEKRETFEYRKYLPAPSDADIVKIEIPQKMQEEIEKSFSKTENLSDEIKQKMIKTIIDDIKRQIWKKERGYPLCKNCFIPLDYIDEGQEPLCPVCKNIKNG